MASTPVATRVSSLLQARDTIDAIRLRAHRLAVVRKGRVLARSAPVTVSLDTGGAATLDEASYAPTGSDPT